MGIIQNFRVHYCTLFLRFILSRIDGWETASEITKFVSILHANRWIVQAWEAVKPEIVKKGFSKAGTVDQIFPVVSSFCEDCHPFGDVDSVVSADTRETKALMSQLVPTEGRCFVTEFNSGDNDLLFALNLMMASGRNSSIHLLILQQPPLPQRLNPKKKN